MKLQELSNKRVFSFFIYFIRKTINLLLNEKKENRNKVEELKREKNEFWKELSSIRETMQKLNSEIEFMSKKFMQTSDHASSPDKLKREKELQLASLQIQVILFCC